MKIIGHLDMDAFFAAIEERDNPRWQGLPIVVGAEPMGGKGRGVVSTANYKARALGIHSAMPVLQAWRLSEAAKNKGESPAIFLPVDYRRYEETSRRVFSILRYFAKTVEEASIDEAYFDLTIAGSYRNAGAFCQKIKKEIRNKEKLTASIGVGPNKLIAKIASDFKKPDGLTIITESEAPKFLEPMTVRKIPGVGPKTEALLNEKKIMTIADLKKISERELEITFGKLGRSLYLKARGIDESSLVEYYETKSVGEQETFLIDTRDSLFIFEKLKKICCNVWQRFKQEKFKKFKTVCVTIRFADFENKSHSHTLEEPVDALNILEFEAMKLILPFLDKRANPQKKSIRLIGVRVEKLL